MSTALTPVPLGAHRSRGLRSHSSPDGVRRFGHDACWEAGLSEILAANAQANVVRAGNQVAAKESGRAGRDHAV